MILLVWHDLWTVWHSLYIVCYNILIYIYILNDNIEMPLSVFIPYSLACEREKCGVLLSPARLPLWLPVRWRSLCTPLCRSPVWKTWFLLCGHWNQSTKMFVSVCVYSKLRSVIEILTIEVLWIEKVHLQSQLQRKSI